MSDEEKLYRSKKHAYIFAKGEILKQIAEFVAKNPKINVRCLRRKASLLKFEKILLSRGPKWKQRARVFFVALDILRRASAVHSTCTDKNGFRCYAIKGMAADGTVVEIHLREEVSIHKDRVLFFVSCFPVKK